MVQRQSRSISTKLYLITFISVYILISLPAMFGFGFVIDWDPEATLYQKVKGYVTEGLFSYVLFKIVIANVVAILVSLGVSKRRQHSGN
ncbi:hypothetical protein FIU87_02940 [Bacillus sp. THAF10]|uniref:hypothetical protein n=1 Tax=Bacillus sp. THAF10 TaxID=2587848 RepID=UPI0012679180|nr:hypothetical protein [Bacillus sp. THAF10]QFT87596.1 hypothetical protein FIU87_02940 [Bacillus sp. THAF10]